MDNVHISQRTLVTQSDRHLARLHLWAEHLKLWVRRPFPAAAVIDDFKPCSRTEDALSFFAVDHDAVIRPIERHLQNTHVAFRELVATPSDRTWRRLRYTMDSLRERIERAVNAIDGARGTAGFSMELGIAAWHGRFKKAGAIENQSPRWFSDWVKILVADGIAIRRTPKGKVRFDLKFLQRSGVDIP